MIATQKPPLFIPEVVEVLRKWYGVLPKWGWVLHNTDVGVIYCDVDAFYSGVGAFYSDVGVPNSGVGAFYSERGVPKWVGVLQNSNVGVKREAIPVIYWDRLSSLKERYF